MMTIHEEVLDFIHQFAVFGTDVRDCFSNGMCYWFAHILKTRFQSLDADIMYAPITNHIFCRIMNRYYDISGEYTPTEAIYFWEYYGRYDKLERDRIERDCIRKERIE